MASQRSKSYTWYPVFVPDGMTSVRQLILILFISYSRLKLEPLMGFRFA